MSLGLRLAPTLITIPIVLTCLALGVWQLERLQWKRDLIAEREAAIAAPPVAPPRSLAEARGMQFRRVFAEGVFLHDKEIYLGATSPRGGEAGFDVLTPLREAEGHIVFVNRGFVPSRLKDPKTRSPGQLEGQVRIAGLLRLPPQEKPGPFLPDNRADINYWFWVDLPAMAGADGLDNVAPFYIEADATPNPGGWPLGKAAATELPNNHLQYAITWFSLAAGMVVVYIVSQIQGRRSV
jgi:surfeit locus 1 family protein